jgi:hypothetical protein
MISELVRCMMSSPKASGRSAHSPTQALQTRIRECAGAALSPQNVPEPRYPAQTLELRATAWPQRCAIIVARNSRNVCHQRNRGIRKFLAIFAATSQCGSENSANGDTQKRVRCIRTVIHILLKLMIVARRSPAPAYERDGVNLQQKRGGAELSVASR